MQLFYGNGFNHLKNQLMACSLKEEVGCARKYGSLRLKSLHKMIKMVKIGCLQKGKKVWVERCIERGNQQQEPRNSKWVHLDKCSFEHPGAGQNRNFYFA